MIEAKAFGICPGIEIAEALTKMLKQLKTCLLYTSPSPRV